MVLAGQRYGQGSSRDWAAKGLALLGVRAVLASSFERIHRTNLIGIGILPLSLPGGVDALRERTCDLRSNLDSDRANGTMVSAIILFAKNPSCAMI